MKKTLEKFKTTYTELPKLEVKKLWYSNYWDGAISGLCTVNGVHCWFDQIEEWDDNNERPDYDENPDWESPWYRRYLVVELTLEQLDKLQKDHDKFRRMVGSHCDYDENGKNKPRFPADHAVTQQSMDQYYEEAKTREPWELEAASDANVLGWYEWT